MANFVKVEGLMGKMEQAVERSRLSNRIKEHSNKFVSELNPITSIVPNRMAIVERQDSVKDESVVESNLPIYTQADMDVIVDFTIEATIKEIEKKRAAQKADCKDYGNPALEIPIKSKYDQLAKMIDDIVTVTTEGPTITPEDEYDEIDDDYWETTPCPPIEDDDA